MTQDGPAQPRSGDGHIMLLAVGGVVAAVLAAWLQLLLGSGETLPLALLLAPLLSCCWAELLWAYNHVLPR